MALLRIVVGLFTLAELAMLWPDMELFFSDQGMFETDVARKLFAARQFQDPFRWSAYLAGPNWSPLLVWDSPGAVWCYAAGLVAAATCFTLGIATRLTKWITFLGFAWLLQRNRIFWAGEQVYLNFLLLLCLSRCDRAYSLDERRRVRRARPLPPLDRSIPAWPRILAMLQFIPIYCANGLVKTGPTWARGDALYYALNQDDFYRFAPHGLSATLGTNVFRVATWVTHAWEVLFPLAVLGVFLRWSIRAQTRPRSVGEKWVSRLSLLTLGASVLGLAGVSHPAASENPTRFTGLGIVVLATVAVVGHRFAHKPDARDWALRWILGRRVWLGMGLAFHGLVAVSMNVGWFVPLTAAAYVVFLEGSDIDALSNRVRRNGKASSAAAVAPVDVPLSVGRRFAVGLFVVVHVLATTVTLLPWRRDTPGARPVVQASRRWLNTLRAVQVWRMFAPNAPRRNTFLVVHVTDEDGRRHLAWPGLSSPTRPLPYIGYDPMRKTFGRIAGLSKYQVPFAEYVCRTWGPPDGSVGARTVELTRVSYPVPSPVWTQKHGPFDPTKAYEHNGQREVLLMIDCPR